MGLVIAVVALFVVLDFAVMLAISSSKRFDTYTAVECLVIPIVISFVSSIAAKVCGFDVASLLARQVFYVIVAVLVFVGIKIRDNGTDNLAANIIDAVSTAMLFSVAHYALVSVVASVLMAF